MIDWSRLAEPQVDGYDSAVILKFAMAEVSPRYGAIYTRRPVTGALTLFNGAVAVRHLHPVAPPPVGPRHVNGPLDVANAHQAIDYLQAWPIAHRQFITLMDTLNPIVPAAQDTSMSVSASHSEEELFGTMYATCHDPVSLAECFVHEMAHHKLRALGVGISRARTLVSNSIDDLYVSPIIKDRLRPMTAVLHATYALIHITALDIHVLQRGQQGAEQDRFQKNLSRNLARLHEGLNEVRHHIQVGANGRAFLDGLDDWAERVVKAGQSLV
ncbi:aKG-HExxH-type peptide beta-hydroxylase [Corallococcus macrosporus]|uniref:aKG-HExxH-type peptide beta-hydroxylase n=1 Tax=Corallococcus macrosporus TaxID=35 RepID=UPI00130EC676|nr:HEXXH motif-containing putative peptide modification protein [Corallococcus macrosporus]